MALAGTRSVLMVETSNQAYPEKRGQPRRRARRRRSLGLGLGGLFDFGPFVIAAGRANPMGHARLGTVGARDEARDRHLVVVGASHIALRSAFSSLGYRHGL